MVRTILLLVIILALVLLVLSNLAPISLKFLGLATLPLPLGVWVIVAIVAGVITTLVFAALFRLGRPTASSRRFTQRSNPNRFTDNPPRAPWAGWANRSDKQTTSNSTTSQTYAGTASSAKADDWGSSGRSPEEWEDWNDYQEPTQTRYGPETIRDREDETWANWDGYEGSRRDAADREDDFGDDVGSDRREENVPPRRIDFEVQQQPEVRQQTGSIYSYSYRKPVDEPPISPADSPTPPPPNTVKSGEVYDAEYRVITPPYRPDPEEPEPFSVPPAPEPAPESTTDDDFDFDDDDWGLDDQPDSKDDRSKW